MILTWNSGWLNGLLSSASLILPLGDLGAGVASITPSTNLGGPLTFTRATAATTVRSDGRIVSVATGTARSYYDPTSLIYRGYLSEGAATNICLQSEDFTTTWTTAGLQPTTVTANQTTAPDGNATADLITDNSTNNGAYGVSQAITILASTTYTVSIFVKKRDHRYIQIAFPTGGSGHLGYFDLDNNGADTGFGSGTINQQAQVYPNGWLRLSITAASGVAETTATFYVLPTDLPNSSSYNGVIGAGTFVWGANAHVSLGFPMSYIATTTASVTRNADSLTMAAASVFSESAGSVYAEAQTTLGATPTMTSDGRIIGAQTGPTGGFAANLTNTLALWDGTAAASVATGANWGTATVKKCGGGWSGVTYVAVLDGLVGTTVAYDGSAWGTPVGFGCTGGGLVPFYGTVKNVRIWTTRLTDVQLKALTS